MARRLALNPDICYMLGLHACNRRAQSAVVTAVGSDALVERFVKIAVQQLGIEPSKILIRDLGTRKSAFFYNSKLRKHLDSALERKEHIFKYRNEYSASYFAALFDCNGVTGKDGTFIGRLSALDSLTLERLGFHTLTKRGRCYIANSLDFMLFIKPFSVAIAHQPGYEQDPC